MYEIDDDYMELIRQIHSTYMIHNEQFHLRVKYRDIEEDDKIDVYERLMRYYRIIVAFEFEPFCMTNEQYAIEQAAFRHLKDTMPESEKDAWRALILRTIRINGSLTSWALSKKFYEMSQTERL